jgi:hypothetical protein
MKWLAFAAECNVKLWLIGTNRKLGRKLRVVNAAPRSVFTKLFL